jgi:hypothetical protein
MDETTAHHIGAGLKKLARKVFAFSRIDVGLIAGLIDAEEFRQPSHNPKPQTLSSITLSFKK